MNHIYLDNAASAPMFPEVIRTMTEIMTSAPGNPSSTHFQGRTARAKIEKARKEVAEHLGADSSEIFFTSGGTESNNTVLRDAVEQMGVARIITAPTEHSSVLNTLEYLQRTRGPEIIYLPVDHQGRIDPEELKNELGGSKQKTLVSLMHANNETGLLHPIKKIGEICRDSNALFHTDAVQTVGHLPLDLSSGLITFLSASAHKFHGPKGTGILYVRKDHPVEPMIRGGNQEKGVRAGTENVAGIAGTARALSLCADKLEEKANYIRGLRKYAIEQLGRMLPDIEIISPLNPEESLFTILNLQIPESDKSSQLLMNMDIEGISVSGGSACHSGAETVSHVITALGRAGSGRPLRISLSMMNTREDIDAAITALQKHI